MKKLFFTFLLLTQNLIAFSNLSDDVSNRNFASNPNCIRDAYMFLENVNIESFKKVVVLSR